MPVLALLASPLLGPATWAPVARRLRADGHGVVLAAGAAPPRAPADVLRALLAALPDDELVLVPHSNAGLYVPALAAERPVVGAVFVDAALPPPHGAAPTAPPRFLASLRERAGADQRLPVWTEWWDEADVAALFPDSESRRRVEAEQHRVPLGYFEQRVPVPAGWDALACAYVAFGDTYAAEVERARAAGWQVRVLPGRHLHALVDPAAVAAAVTEAAGAVLSARDGPA